MFLNVRLDVCAFSGYKIYPARGVLFVRSDSRPFRLLSGKCEAHFLLKKNPRKYNWTVFYRRLHKKGSTESLVKRRARRTVKSMRGIIGVTPETIKAKRSQPVELREAARAESLLQAKQKKKDQQAAKKQEKIRNIATRASEKSAQLKAKSAKSMKTKPLARSR